MLRIVTNISPKEANLKNQKVGKASSALVF